MRGSFALTVLLTLAGAVAAEDPPILREVELRGVTYFEHGDVLKALRLKIGRRFHRDAPEVAASLRAHYDGQCFMAVSVQGAFDPATGNLTLTVDEGKLARVDIEGVEGDAEARARELLGLEPGRPLREKDLRAALERMERGSGGAFRPADPPYTLERTPEGVRLQLHLSSARTRLVLRPKGPDLSPLYNRVEGTAPGVGLDLILLDRSTFNHTTLYGRASYGFASEEPRYAAGIRRPFGPKRRLTLGYEFHDLTDSDDAFRRLLVEQPSRGRGLSFSILEDYHRRRGHEVYAFLRPRPRIHLGVNWRRDRHESLPVAAEDRVFGFARRARPNPGVGEGLMQSLIVTGRWAPGGDLYRDPIEEAESFLVRNPYGGAFERTQRMRADVSFEQSLAGDFKFRRGIAHLRRAFDLTARQGLNVRVLAGLTDGEPPPQKQFALGGAGTLRGYGLKEFPGDRMLLASLEWNYEPLSRLPGVIAFYDGGMAWTRGREGAGFKDDVGMGLEWPGGGRGYLRADVALALRPTPGRDRARVHALLRVPF